MAAENEFAGSPIATAKKTESETVETKENRFEKPRTNDEN